MLRLRYYTLALLIAFLANAVLPFFAVYSLPAHEAGIEQLSSVFGEKILLCTGDGFKWVKLSDLQSGKEKPKPHSGYECPLCYAASHGLKSMALAPGIALRGNTYAYAPQFAKDFPHVSFFLAAHSRVRAPPLYFIG